MYFHYKQMRAQVELFARRIDVVIFSEMLLHISKLFIKK